MASTNGPPPPGEWNGWPFDFSGFPHDDFGPQLNYAVWTLTCLAAGFLGLRIYCKFLRHRGLWWDDHVLIISWVSLLVQSAMVSYNTTIGYGKHIWDFHPKDLSTFLLMSNTSGFFSILAAMWSKTSFGITVLRISDGWTRIFIWFIIISINIALGFAALSTYIQCAPAAKLWNPMMEGRCWPKEFIIQYNVFTAAYSGTMDIILAILPWRIIWKLRMNKKEKVGVMLAMSMGVFAGAMSLIKITQLPAINHFDLISGIWLSILGTAESAITIMAASIPILRALIRDTPPRPPPVRFFYRPHMMYTGDLSSTGRSSTIISSRPRSTSASSNIHNNHPNRSSMGNGGSRRASRLSMSWAYSWTNRRNRDSTDEWFRKMAATPEPPPGKIIQTEEVSVEWEEAEVGMDTLGRDSSLGGTDTRDAREQAVIGQAL